MAEFALCCGAKTTLFETKLKQCTIFLSIAHVFLSTKCYNAVFLFLTVFQSNQKLHTSNMTYKMTLSLRVHTRTYTPFLSKTKLEAAATVVAVVVVAAAAATA